jgi:nucleoside-diphosphate-sugar epimerase
MKILITGNMGYVGPVLVRHLRSTRPTATIVGLDTGFFAHFLTPPSVLPESLLDVQHFADVRSFPPEALAGVDAVIHLAAISNDPMGKAFEAITADINHRASVRLAEEAKRAGARAFVFASSCSMYGSAEDEPRIEQSELNPLTAYARSKVATERDLENLAGRDFRVTCLRFGTACGMSDRLRLDLVLNDFVASAVASGKITVLSDGSPWRPLIHVSDMALAADWAMDRELGDDYLAVNTGVDEWNYQVRDLAEAVATELPGTEVDINRDASPDKRSYRVSFELFKSLAPDHQPRTDLQTAIRGLAVGLERMNFSDLDFRESTLMRLKALKMLRDTGLLTESLTWASKTSQPAPEAVATA